ncbi:hypothetical protein [Pseudoalteromonas virus vB_PspP-H6/1]|nr:hypothetical protein [Pseudoalteromonas virus vB_PspP-H6/1]
MNEQTLKQERKHYELECKIRKAAKKAQADTLAEKRARAEFNKLMKDYGVEL